MPSRPMIAAVVVLIVCAGLAVPAAALTIVKDGQAQAAIVVSPAAFDAKLEKIKGAPVGPQVEKLAALDLQAYIEKISGAKLEIVAAGEGPGGLALILVGAAAPEKLDEETRKVSQDPAAFIVEVSDKEICLRGLSGDGTAFAADELLEQLGVRWYMPGPLGEVVPLAKTIEVKNQKTVQGPSFPSRHLQGVADEPWCRHMRFSGPNFPASHGISLPKDITLEAKPECFSLVNGKRTKRQLCLSNPEVLQATIQTTKEYFRKSPTAEIIGMGANDGGGFCECAKCKALDAGDFDRYGNNMSVTDRYVWFFNQVLDGIADEFPDKKIGFYAYSLYNQPPVKIKPSSRLVPAVALITLCRIHGMSEPICEEKQFEKQIIAGWTKLAQQVYYRGYWFNLADPGMPFFIVQRVASDIREGKKLGIYGWRVETLAEWKDTPSLYVAGKLMWNADADLGALMADFYEKFFGPAGPAMKKYMETMENARAKGDFHTGSCWDMPQMYNAKVRGEARAALAEAARLADTPDRQKRVWVYTRTMDYLDAFVKMVESRQQHDYLASKEGLDQMNAIREELLAFKPPLLGKTAKSYLDRFFSTTTLQGAARVSGGNTLLAGLKDQWDFRTDEKRMGEGQGWFNVERPAGEWKTISSSIPWSTQGLRYYKGLAWYRQTVDVPASAAGKRVFLWIGGYDELAKVWINGKEVGISPRNSFQPCEMDATSEIEPGKPNTVVICVRNETLDELGTGGLTGPVMFYIPAAGEKAEPENLKPPAKTFPEY